MKDKAMIITSNGVIIMLIFGLMHTAGEGDGISVLKLDLFLI
jgi:hypothetical protein